MSRSILVDRRPRRDAIDRLALQAAAILSGQSSVLTPHSSLERREGKRILLCSATPMQRLGAAAGIGALQIKPPCTYCRPSMQYNACVVHVIFVRVRKVACSQLEHHLLTPPLLLLSRLTLTVSLFGTHGMEFTHAGAHTRRGCTCTGKATTPTHFYFSPRLLSPCFGTPPIQMRLLDSVCLRSR